MKKPSVPELQLASGDYLSVVRDFALSKGINLHTLLKDSQVELKDLINPPPLVTNLIVSHVGINLFNALDEPISAAVEFGLRMTASTHGSLGLAVQCAENLQEGFQILSEFYNTRLAAQDINISETETKIRIKLSYKNGAALHNEVQQYFDISTLVSIASNTYQALDKTKLQGSILININQSEPDGFDHNALPGITLRFDQPSLEMLTPIEWKYQPLNIANREMAEAALMRCQSELKRIHPVDLVERIRLLVEANTESLPKLHEVAETFNMSSATLKRKLRDKGTSYLDIKNEIRLAQSCALILDNEPIDSVAARMGFSDASNFTKAFKGWTGLSPKAFREVGRVD
jgi:AraC-like DNA-binding protein